MLGRSKSWPVVVRLDPAGRTFTSVTPVKETQEHKKKQQQHDDGVEQNGPRVPLLSAPNGRTQRAQSSPMLVRTPNLEGAGSGGTVMDPRKTATLSRHYYPEGGWGWVVVVVSVLVHILNHGLQLGGGGVLLGPMARNFQQSKLNAGYGRMNETNITSKVVNWCPVPTHPHWLMYPPVHPAVHYVLGTVLLAVGIAGVIGNGLALIVFTRFTKVVESRGHSNDTNARY